MRLGKIELEHDTILAPMMDVTTPSFRQLILNQGGLGMVVVPMVFVEQVAHAKKTIIPHLEHLEKQRPAALQIVSNGRNEEAIKNALDFLRSYKFDLIDINSGCPARHTMNSGGGGALIRKCMYGDSEKERDLFKKVIETTIKYSDKPVSVKTRLGYENKEEIFDFGKMILDFPIEFLTVHLRTIKQGYSGEVGPEEFQILKKLKETLGKDIPIVGNGDIKDYATYQTMKEQTGCDAVMVGRAIKSNPYMFSQIEQSKQAIRNNQPLPEFPEVITFEQTKEIIRQNEEFITNSSRFWSSDRFKLAESRRLAIWTIKGIVNYKKVRAILSRISDYSIFKEYINGPQILDDFSNPDLEIR